MNKIYLSILLIAILTGCNNNRDEYAQFEPEKVSGKGTLVIIGGGERTDEIMSKILKYGGGENARVLVVPFASEEADVVGPFQSNQFKTLGCKSSEYIICTREEIDLDENLKKLDSITVVFFSGGDQVKLVKHLKGTKFLDKIKDIYNRGGVVSGTSAGAAVMSRIMITGEQLSDTTAEPAFDKIAKGDVVTSEGFGFLNNIVIDQHFLIRKRENRLFSVLKDNPTLRGIGIDESTAIVVKSNNTLDVIGVSQVLIYEPLYKGSGELNEFRIKILKEGESYKF